MDLIFKDFFVLQITLKKNDRTHKVYGYTIYS